MKHLLPFVTTLAVLSSAGCTLQTVNTYIPDPASDEGTCGADASTSNEGLGSIRSHLQGITAEPTGEPPP